jgi:hypothetical protein
MEVALEKIAVTGYSQNILLVSIFWGNSGGNYEGIKN